MENVDAKHNICKVLGQYDSNLLPLIEMFQRRLLNWPISNLTTQL